jgi:hypothetical protein
MPLQPEASLAHTFAQLARRLATAALLLMWLAPIHVFAARADDPQKVKVLILGDSLALCGFGKRLDERFRSDPRVEATYTYMACGTNPLSWLKQKPYTTIKSPCGFWSIEPKGDSNELKEMQDTYGTKKNQAPKAHLVPKLEDLIASVKPDVLVIQTGSNLFGLFPDTKTVRPAQHGPALKKYLGPFREITTSPPSTLRKVYYVNPPISGRVAKEVQDFVYEQTRSSLTPALTVIDSRKLVEYPYKNMDPDKEHFLGEEMTQWADKVFDIVQNDLSTGSLAQMPPLSAGFGTAAEGSTPARAELANPEVAARAERVGPVETPARAEAVVQQVAQAPAKQEPIQVKARLVFKSKPMPLKELMPYQESLVGYVYEIDKVLRGQYNERQILVMHPAHIALKEQKLDKFKIGKRYKLRLDRMEGSLWDTAKARDESNQINLQPYMRLDDKAKHPGNRPSR